MSNNVKYTPGPWRVGRAHGLMGVYNVDVGNDITTEMDIANARLIAAAPELLEVIKYALDFANEDYPKYDQITVRMKLESAIKLAEGRN